MSEERQQLNELPKTLCISHRGDTQAFRENTIPALEGAWRTGVDMVELDVRVLGDHTVVLFHDAAIEGQMLDSLSYAELQALTPEYDVPTLTDALASCSPDQTVLVDLKGSGRAFIDPLVEVLKNAQAVWPKLLLQSSHLSILERLAHEFEDSSLFYLAKFKGKSRPWQRPNADALATMLAENGISGITARDRWFINKSFMAPFQARDIVFYVWTVNSARRVRRYLSSGVDGIITDFPELVVR